MNASTQDTNIERLWAIGIGVFAALLLVIGPVQVVFPAIETLLVLVSLVLLGVSAWRLRNGLPSRYAFWALALFSVGLLLLGAQLIPLPPEVWTALPGRQVVLDTFSAAKITPGFAPFSMDPVLTRGIFLYIMPSIALLFASLASRPESRGQVMFVLLVAAVLCALLGLVQRFQGGNSSFFLFPDNNADPYAKGTFLNRNFFAAQLYCTVPVVIAFAVDAMSGRSLSKFVVAFLYGGIFVALMAALGAAGSRTGLGLGMLAVLLSCGLIWRGRNKNVNAASFTRYVLPLASIAILLLAQFGLVALLRIAQSDTASDLRSTITPTTIEAIQAYFPFGSGFGSFVPVYKLFEHPDQLMPQFVNAAHNDWLQLALEGGLPMIILLAGFVLWFLAASLSVWRKGSESLEDSLLRAASIIIFLLLLHSVVDYPLRTRALMGFFAISCGFLAYGVHFRPMRKRQASSRPEVFQATTAKTGPRPERTSPYFVKKGDGPHQ